MIKLGEYQELIVVKKVEFGVYLAQKPEDETRVLLPAKQVPQEVKIGDVLKVFLYKDSKDRLIATTNTPKLQLEQLAVLEVLEIGKIGAFLDWGLEKDLFLPFKEMTRKVEPGDEILVTLYIDKSRRLCATMKGIYDLLSKESPYKEGDTVQGRVYEFSDNFGTFIAVDDRYSAMNPDAEKVLEIIDEYAGVLPFNDKASPEVIKRETGLSKNAFKRAVGHLYKEHKIEITDKVIRKL